MATDMGSVQLPLGLCEVGLARQHPIGRAPMTAQQTAALPLIRGATGQSSAVLEGDRQRCQPSTRVLDLLLSAQLDAVAPVARTDRS